MEHEPVDNPYRMFYNIYYEDDDYQMFDATPYNNKIVKVIVRKRSDNKKYERFIDKLYASGIADLKIVENQLFNGWYDKEEFNVMESEDTLSILNRYVQESEGDLDKSRIQSIITDIYQEACEMI